MNSLQTVIQAYLNEGKIGRKQGPGPVLLFSVEVRHEADHFDYS